MAQQDTFLSRFLQNLRKAPQEVARGITAIPQAGLSLLQGKEVEQPDIRGALRAAPKIADLFPKKPFDIKAGEAFTPRVPTEETKKVSPTSGLFENGRIFPPLFQKIPEDLRDKETKIESFLKGSTEKIIGIGEKVAKKAEKLGGIPGLPGGPLKISDLVRGAAGAIATPLGLAGEAITSLREERPVKAAFEAGFGVLSITPAGAIFNAVASTSEARPLVEKVFSTIENAEKYAVSKEGLADLERGLQALSPGFRLPTSPKSISGKLESLPQNTKDFFFYGTNLAVLAALHAGGKKVFGKSMQKTEVPLRNPETGTIEKVPMLVPTEAGYWKGVADSFLGEMKQFLANPSKYINEKANLGLGIREEGERGKITSLKTIREKLPRPGVTEAAPLPELTTRVLEKLGDRKEVSRQFIENLAQMPELRQPERDLIRAKLGDFKGDTIPVPEFVGSVRVDLLPLSTGKDIISLSKIAVGKRPIPNTQTAKYEGITLPSDIRGRIENYGERIYESPIKTSAGGVHFSETDYPNYFAHTRIEDIPGQTRRIIEVQSDLFQKGRLESEKTEIVIRGYPIHRKAVGTFAKDVFGLRKGGVPEEQIQKFLKQDEEALSKFQARDIEISKLEPYRNTWFERIIREETKQAAKDGVEKLQFPTGETAMKIEGLGDVNSRRWRIDVDDPSVRESTPLVQNKLKVGQQISDGTGTWIITDVFGDGKFKAMPKEHFDSFAESKNLNISGKDLIFYAEQHATKNFWGSEETFDISGKVDTKNPIYKFYEKDVQKFLKREFSDMKQIKDPQGVTWWEVPITSERQKLLAEKPIFAFKAKPREGGIPEEARAKEKIEDFIGNIRIDKSGLRPEQLKAVQGVQSELFRRGKVKEDRPFESLTFEEQVKEAARKDFSFDSLEQYQKMATSARQNIDRAKLELLKAQKGMPELQQKARLGDPKAIEQFDTQVQLMFTLEKMISESARATGGLRKNFSEYQRFVKQLKEAGKTESEIRDILLKTPAEDLPKKLLDMSRVTWSQKTNVVRISSMLSDWGTQLVNVIGNTFGMLTRIPERATAGLLDRGFSKFAGKKQQVFEREAVDMIQELGRRRTMGTAFSNGINTVLDVQKFKESFTHRDALGILDSLLEGKVKEFGKASDYVGTNRSVFQSRLGKAAETPLRILGAMDNFFRAVIGGQETAALARRQGLSKGLRGEALEKDILATIQNPPESILKAATIAAETGTFNQRLGKIMSIVQNGLNTLSRGSRENILLDTAMQVSFTLAKPFLQFLKIPVNLVKWYFDRTPLGFLKLAKKGLSYEERLNVIAKATLWAPVQAILIEKIFSGDIEFIGGVPLNPNERRAFYEGGKKPNSLRVGNQYYELSRFAPLSNFILVPGSLYQGWRNNPKGTPPWQKSLTSFGAFVNSQVDQTFLQGAKDFIVLTDRIFRGDLGGVQSEAVQFLTSFIPNIVAGRTRGSGTILREPRRDTFLNQLIDTTLSKIPKLGERVEPRLTFFGEEIPRTKTFLGLMNVGTTDADSRLINKTFERLKYFPSDLPNKIDDFDITPEEKNSMKRAVGNSMKKTVIALIKSPSFERLNPEEQKEILERAIRQERIGLDAMRAAIVGKKVSLPPGAVDQFYNYYKGRFRDADLKDMTPEKRIEEIQKEFSGLSPFEKRQLDDEKKELRKLLEAGKEVEARQYLRESANPRSLISVFKQLAIEKRFGVTPTDVELINKLPLQTYLDYMGYDELVREAIQKQDASILKRNPELQMIAGKRKKELNAYIARQIQAMQAFSGQ